MPLLINDSGARFGLISGRVPPAGLSATFLLKATFDLHFDGTATLLPEDDQPHFDGDASWDDLPSRGLRTASDFAPFKPGTDLVLAGHAHAPGGQAVPYLQVSFGVGSFRKPAVVFGDRYDRGGLLGGSLSEPLPFLRMPLDWSRAYGGPNLAANPIGRGASESTLADGTRVRLAPNVESLDQALSLAGGRPEPWGFCPLDPAWPQRMRKVGSYGGSYVKDHWPGYPPDFDWSFFNAAPADQVLPGVYLRGDEALEFRNLDPEFPEFRSTLPGLQARCFARVRRAGRLEFREVTMRIDTLFADMDARRVTLVWRGVTPAATPKLREFEEFFVLLEPGARPLGRSPGDYDAMAVRRREEYAEEFDVPPVELEPLVMPNIVPPSTAWADRLEEVVVKLRAELAASGVDIPMPLGVDGRPLPAAKIPAPKPPPATVKDAVAFMGADFAELDAIHPGLLKKYPLPDFDDLIAADTELDAFTGVDLPEPPEADVEWTRQLVEARLAEGGSLAGQNLSGLDLSGISFAGVGLAGSDLSEANLENTVFDDANLVGAQLAECRLDGASLRRARLDEADMGGVSAVGARFDECRLDRTDFTGSRLAKTSFRSAGGDRASFNECDLTGADFTSAQFPGGDFSEALLSGSDFSGALLTGADFESTEVIGGRFEKASAVNLRASKSNMERASFRDCLLDESIFEDAVLVDTDFRGTQLRRATMTAARIDRAVFGLADLRQAKLDEVRAHQATFVGVNLFRGSFELADLSKATFVDCNLYDVEFFDAVLDQTRFDDCNVKGTRLAR
jgi:uncharacterized protein YjbI with pentapeptide repeats